MNCCNSYKDLPTEIKEELTKANLFFTEAYAENVSARHQTVCYCWTDNYIQTARIKKKWFLKAAVLESEPFQRKSGEDEKEFLNDVMQALKEQGVQWTVCATTARFQHYPEHSKVAPCGNFIIDLTLTEEELWKNVHSKHRNSIRRGEKAGIAITMGGTELLEEYVPVSNETYKRSGIGANTVAYYTGVIDKLPDNAVVFLAKKDGVVQAGGMFYYNHAMAYYLHGASIGRPEPGVTNYMLWRAILYFKEKGVQKFSFVGYHYDAEPNSKLDGIQRFKQRFGGTLEKSYNFRYEQNTLGYKVYGLAMQLKAGKPFQKYRDAIDDQMDKYPELNGGKTS